MFNTTHTFVGLAIAKTFPQKWVRHAALTAVIASNLPDVDSIAGFWGTAAYLDHHRGITHSLIGVPILALMLSAAMYFFSENFWRTYTVAVVAMATHPLLDYLNPYGLRPFLPWNRTWYYGDSVFIFDPYLDAVLLLGLVAATWLRPGWRRLAAAASMSIAVLYIGVRVELHAMAVRHVEAVDPRVRGVEKLAVLPNMWNPLIWDVIAVSSTGAARFDVCALPCRRVNSEATPMNNAASSKIADIAERAATARSAAALLHFARFPLTRVEKLSSGYRVTFFDFRFYRETTETALGSEVMLDESLGVVKEDLSFLHRIK